MNRTRFFLIGSIILVALSVAAQQSPNGSASDQQHQQAVQAGVDGHLRILTEKLNLTAEQQMKMRPVIQHFLEGQQALMADKNLTEGQRSARSEELREQANKQAREFLTDQQQAELTQMEQGSHSKAGTN